MESEVSDRQDAEEEFQWDVFVEALRHYVRLELAGEDAEATYPEWAFHIRTSIECRDAYLQELHQQSLAQVDIAALEQVSILLQQPDHAMPIRPAADWRERTIEHGRAWLESATERWRQVELSLADLRVGAEGTAPAMVGLMSDDAGSSGATQASLQIAPENSGFELSLIVSMDANAGTADLYRAEVLLTLFDRLGDYSGVELYLTSHETRQHAITDKQGRAHFTNLPAAQLTSMHLTVLFPEETS